MDYLKTMNGFTATFQDLNAFNRTLAAQMEAGRW